MPHISDDGQCPFAGEQDLANSVLQFEHGHAFQAWTDLGSCFLANVRPKDVSCVWSMSHRPLLLAKGDDRQARGVNEVMGLGPLATKGGSWRRNADRADLHPACGSDR